MTEHCTLWFDGNWGHCCYAHDVAYANGADRLASDWALAVCVAQAGHVVIAAIMFAGVSLFGWLWYFRAKYRK